MISAFTSLVTATRATKRWCGWAWHPRVLWRCSDLREHTPTKPSWHDICYSVHHSGEDSAFCSLSRAAHVHDEPIFAIEHLITSPFLGFFFFLPGFAVRRTRGGHTLNGSKRQSLCQNVACRAGYQFVTALKSTFFFTSFRKLDHMRGSM